MDEEMTSANDRGGMDFLFYLVVVFAGMNLLFNLVKPTERCCCGGSGR